MTEEEIQEIIDEHMDEQFYAMLAEDEAEREEFLAEEAIMLSHSRSRPPLLTMQNSDYRHSYPLDSVHHNVRRKDKLTRTGTPANPATERHCRQGFDRFNDTPAHTIGGLEISLLFNILGNLL